MLQHYLRESIEVIQCTVFRIISKSAVYITISLHVSDKFAYLHPYAKSLDQGILDQTQQSSLWARILFLHSLTRSEGQHSSLRPRVSKLQKCDKKYCCQQSTLP